MCPASRNVTVTPSTDEKRAFVADGDKLVQRLLRVGDGVKRLDRRQIFFGALLGDELRVRFLDVAGIHEHDGAEVARGEGAMDVAGVALLDEVRQIARVIHVRVAQDDGVNLLRVERETAVAVDGFFAVALE